MEHSKRSREQPKVTQHICAGARIGPHSTLTFCIALGMGACLLLQKLTSLFGNVPSALPECLSHTQPHPVIDTVDGKALPVPEVQLPGSANCSSRLIPCRPEAQRLPEKNEKAKNLICGLLPLKLS